MRAHQSTSFAGIIGWPLEHTLSPVIHNAAFRNMGIDWIYLAWPVAPEVLAPAVGGLRALGAIGVNVTMPHKEAVIAHLDEVSGDARTVGAVNTIQLLGDKFIGHNTDVDGFRQFLVDDAGVDLSGRRSLVLGAGGAARAVVKALDDLGAGEITVAARRPERGANLLELATRGPATVVAWKEAETRAGEFDVVINATPVGTGSGDPLPGTNFHPGQIVIDLIYDPPTTALVEKAKAQGAEAWGGLGMLVHQAAASFRIWTGQEAPIEIMSAAALHAVLKR
ncbi:MAG TPA: shikimate dehydrogenase [Actinomycetota bacterium]|nr:shikimate dehydrogenase [Actinomycetota bacterium]